MESFGACVQGGSTVPNLRYRTFSLYFGRGETRCAGCLCTRSGWFKHIEFPRPFLNHSITEIARCGEFCHRSSGLYRLFSIYFVTGETRCAGFLDTRSGYMEHPRTFSNSITAIARCGAFCPMSSGWFDSTEPSLATLFPLYQCR